MKAMIIIRTAAFTDNHDPLRLVDLPVPAVTDREILLRVSTCGVCHTELDEIEGRTPPARFPMVPGHEVVGTVVEKGSKVNQTGIGDRVGVGWIYSACGKCVFCLQGRENLCKDFKATGRDEFGGYAEYMKVQEDYAYPIPENYSDQEAAPLLCAGGVGFRSLNLANIENGEALGLTGFGASGHLVLKLVRNLYPDTPVYVFARSGNERRFALDIGAVWAGTAETMPPVKLKAIIDTTPVWKPVLEGLKNLQPGGRLVINAIRKEDDDKYLLQGIDYGDQLWLEKEVKSVANVTRADISGFLKIAASVDLKPEVTIYSLSEANQALRELKNSMIRGAKVLKIC